MSAKRLVASKRVRLVVALGYATAVSASAVWLLPRKPAIAPSLMIALGLPLVFRFVPRNWLYGMRTPRTLCSSEETWYRQNTITGVVMVAVGIVWLGVLATR